MRLLRGLPCCFRSFLSSIGRKASLRVPKRLLIPFGLYFLWLWFSLLQNPPLDVFLFSIARVFLYFIFVALFLDDKENISTNIGWTIIVLGFIESLLIRFNYTRLQTVYLEQFGGRLGNPLHSGILIPVALFAALSMLLKNIKKNKRPFHVLCIGHLRFSLCDILVAYTICNFGDRFLSLLFMPKSFRKPVLAVGGGVGLILIYFQQAENHALP